MLLMVVGLSQAAPQISTSQVVNTVTSQLQPLISEAVARALASSSVTTTGFGSSATTTGFGNSGFNAGTSSTAGSGLTAEEELEYNRKLSANAQYEYGYKVADSEAQTYMTHDESRNGANVEGQYSYVDATGALVTVSYTAGPEGYQEERNVETGFVEMRNIPGPWTGPLAGVNEVVEVVAPAPVRQVVPYVPAPVRPAAPAVDQSALIQLIISQLQPSINSAVQSAISSSSSVSRQAQATGVPQGPQGFLDGVNSVRVQTPESYIEY